MYHSTLCLALVCLGSVPFAALAQSAGTYTGTTADGENVSFTVTQDATSGEYSITGENIAFNAPCKNSTITLNTAWGTGYSVPITKGVAKLALQDSYFFFSGTLRFTATAMSGTLASTSPNLAYNASGHPTKALFCVSPAQAVTGTLSAAGSTVAASAVPPKAVLLRSQSSH